MDFFNKKTPWQKEWSDLKKKEAKFRERRKDGPTSMLIMKLERFIPKKLTETMNKAFFKAFGVIFDKGTGVIEKTYNRKQSEADFKVNTYAHMLQGNKKTARRFTKKAKAAKALNLTISFIEGIGFGLVGLGIPDIPLFIGMALKSVYQIALSFGYEYESEEEKIFILKIIEVAMKDEDEFVYANEELNQVIDYIAGHGDQIGEWNITKEQQMQTTSEALSKEMLYTKFLQGFMIIGVAGGVFDPIYINRISDYAVLKYRRRFLKAQMTAEE